MEPNGQVSLQSQIDELRETVSNIYDTVVHLQELLLSKLNNNIARPRRMPSRPTIGELDARRRKQLEAEVMRYELNPDPDNDIPDEIKKLSEHVKGHYVFADDCKWCEERLDWFVKLRRQGTVFTMDEPNEEIVNTRLTQIKMKELSVGGNE